MASHPVGLVLSKSVASPYAVWLGLGLGSASYFFWGNLAGQSTGAVFIPVNPPERKKLGIDVGKAVEIWKWGYYRGAIHFGISGAVSAVAVFASAFQAPEGRLVTKKYLLLLSGLLISNALYTFAVMLPTNNRLVAIAKRITDEREKSAEGLAAPLSVTQESEVETLFKKWKLMHYVRLTLGGLGWFGTFAAYLASV